MNDIQESPVVTDLRNWCFCRLESSKEEIKKARQYEEDGFKAIGEGLSELRREAGVSLKELAETEEMHKARVCFSHLALLEEGEEWTEGLIDLYINSVKNIYLKKQSK